MLPNKVDRKIPSWWIWTFLCVKADDLTSPPHSEESGKTFQLSGVVWALLLASQWESHTCNQLFECVSACLVLSKEVYKWIRRETFFFSVSVLNFSCCSWQPLCMACCSGFCLYSPAALLDGCMRVFYVNPWVRNSKKFKQWGTYSHKCVCMMLWPRAAPSF